MPQIPLPTLAPRSSNHQINKQLWVSQQKKKKKEKKKNKKRIMVFE